MIIIFSFLLLALCIYSYTQIDLNLTLFSNSFYQSIQNQLIQIGYFNRPLSTLLFIFLLVSFFICYLFILFLIRKNKIKKNQIYILIGLNIGILFFSYSAFSHDLFNYMFDARIITTYHLNPYTHKALDFPLDLWTRFMHWTHRTYPYGPAWLVFTIPFSFFGFGKFIPTLLLFKLLFSFTYAGNCMLIYRILRKITPKKALFGFAFFALNPLILIESLVSPHLDSVMLFFLLCGFYLLLIKKKTLGSVSFLIISGLVKFVTFPLLVTYVILWRNLPNLEKKLFLFIFLNFFFLLTSVVIPILQRESYPWYFIPLIGVGTFLVDYEWIYILMIGLSFGLLLRYIPFLYMGDYSVTVLRWENILLIIPLLIALVYVLILRKLGNSTTKVGF